MSTHRPAPMIAAALMALLPLLAGSARAGEDEPAPDAPAKARVVDVPDRDAADALERFEREFDTEDIDFKLEALGRLRKVVHPTVAKRLLALTLKGDDDHVRAMAMRGLAFQQTSAKFVGAAVAKMMREEAEVNRKRRQKGDNGLIVDPKTGEVDTVSPEGKEAQRKKRARSEFLAEGVRCLYRLDYRDRNGVETLMEFMGDSNDDLVALVLETFGRWKEWTVLDEIQELWDIYPDEDSWSGGAVRVDTGAEGTTDARAAKAKYNALYGDPDKTRARPKVVRAIKSAVKGITDKVMEKPAELRDYMRAPEVKRKVKAK